MMQVESHENIEYEALIGGEAKFPERLANKIFSITVISVIIYRRVPSQLPFDIIVTCSLATPLIS